MLGTYLINQALACKMDKKEFIYLFIKIGTHCEALIGLLLSPEYWDQRHVHHA